MSKTGTDRDWAAARVVEIVDAMERDARELEIAVGKGPGGSRILDCGVLARGSWEAGRRVTVLSHAGMARATLAVTRLAGAPLPELTCDSWRPALSIREFQTSFALNEVDPSVRVSGPIRAAIDGAVEARAGTSAARAWGVAVVEAGRLPSVDIVGAIARRARLEPSDLTLVVVPAASLAGVTQIAGRLNECVLFTLEMSLGESVEPVVSVLGSVPVAPCGREAALLPDDMIHYAGRVVLVVDAPPAWDLGAVADSLVFRSSPAYGSRFAELLAAAGGVFEAVPGLNDLNKVAEIAIVDRQTGRTARAGGVDTAILEAAWRGAEERGHGR
jgi:methenyltetrahydromethanopterin cyclohydrolase